MAANTNSSSEGTTTGLSDQVRGLPAWYPGWARELADLYFSGTTCMFILHGNVHDLVPSAEGPDTGYCSLVEFLAEGLFGNWDVVLRYDLGHGLRAAAADDGNRLQEMMKYLSTHLGSPQNWSRNPDEVLPTLDALFERNLLTSDSKDRRSIGCVFEYAQFLLPASDSSATSDRHAARLVRFLEWAQNPYIKRVNQAFCLIADKLSDVNPRLVQSAHAAAIEVPMPDLAERSCYLQSEWGEERIGSLTDFTSDRLARLSNGLNLLNLQMLISQADRGGRRVDADRYRALKKVAIERECRGLLEFVEPEHTLDLVVGHEPAKKRLRQDARFMSDGQLDAAPMGYLVCGPVGTGKTFLAECYAGSIGIPCVKLKNFRSKYVGETEGNLQRVLSVLKSLGPVIVIIDEADAALGDRRSSGDSGTSNRVFSMIASQMGDTRYRGRIVWMLLTCRPDLLPIDLKRQGRAEVHIPLFYPESADESAKMFQVMARKNRVSLADDALDCLQLRPDEGEGGDEGGGEGEGEGEGGGERPDLGGNRLLRLSGADIESVVLNAKREMLSQRRSTVTGDDLRNTLAAFIPSAQGLEKELQEIAAVLECTDLEFLPEAWQKVVTGPEGRTQLQNRLVSIRQLIDD